MIFDFSSPNAPLISFSPLRKLERELGHDVFLHLVKAAVAGVLFRDVAGFADSGGRGFRNPPCDRFVSGRRSELHLRLANRITELLDQLKHRLHRFLAEEDRIREVVLAHLRRFSFDHHHCILGCGDHQVAVSGLQLLDRRVGDEAAIDAGHANPGDRAGPRNVARVKGGRATGHREGVGEVFAVGGKHGGDDLDLVAVALGEEGPERTVDQA